MNKFIDFIIAFSLKRKYLILVVTLAVVVMGVVSFRQTPIDAFPDVTNTKVTIITQWPGRSAEEIEKFVTIPIEIAMNSVQKKTDIRSTTLFGLSVVTVCFDDHVNDEFARQQVYNLLHDADLPDGVEPDVQPLSGPTGEIYRYTLRSDKRSVRELKTLQDWVIERKLRSVPGIADIVSFGGEVKTFEVSVNPNQLATYGVSSLELYQAIANSNVNVGGDVIQRSSQAYVVRGIGLINNVREIGDIVVKNIGGTPILVRNLATVHESCQPRLGQVGRGKDDDVVEGIVIMRKGENTEEVIKALKSKIDEIQHDDLPKDVKIVPFYDREDLVNLAVGTVMHNVLEGIILVTLVVLLFMKDWRTTVIVASVIPLALLFAFIALHVCGMSANLLSMGAIDFGIIIDGAVVMVEALFVALSAQARSIGMEAFNRRSHLGMIRQTARGKAKSVFFSKLIIITALLPIFTFQKVEGKMFSPLAYTLGFALLVLTYPEVSQVLTQTGRPNDGTDATGFYNIELFVKLYPEKEWKTGRTKEQVVDDMNRRLNVYPGIDFNFSQPISDNVEEAVSGVKGAIVAKVYGKDLAQSEQLAWQVYHTMKPIRGITDLGVIRNMGQPELQIDIDEDRLARYGVKKDDVQSIIEMAIGGKAASQVYEDERKFNLVVRYEEPFRDNAEAIAKIKVPTEDGQMIPIGELAQIRSITGPLIIYRENHSRYCAVKFSVRDRDMGSAVDEARAKVAKAVNLPAGYKITWNGDFENQKRASARLAQVVPISVLLIFVILYMLFGNARDAGLVLTNVPFAAVGGILNLLITRTNFSISAGIGFICLFGICIQNGVIMLMDIKHFLRHRYALSDAVTRGMHSRIRSVLMTAMMATLGLLPAALSHGIGSESQRPLATVIIGGLVGATVFTLFIFPLIVERIYSHVNIKKLR